MNRVLSKVDVEGLSTTLQVRRTNETAIRFYKKLGFVISSSNIEEWIYMNREAQEPICCCISSHVPQNKMIENIKEHCHTLRDLGGQLVQQSSDALYINTKTSTFLSRLGSQIILFSTQLGTLLEKKEFNKTSYDAIKKQLIDYLNMDKLMTQAEPKLQRDFSTVLYDYMIFIARGFCRIFDVLFTTLSWSDKTMAQRADEKIQEKYTFLSTDTHELKERMGSKIMNSKAPYIFNYSEQLQFFQLDSRAYQQEIKKIHYDLNQEVTQLDQLSEQFTESLTLT